MKPKLLIVSSHPIQYQVPWFRALARDARIELEVLYLVLPDAMDQGVGFGRSFEWDIPLLDGYRWRVAPSARGGIGAGYFGLRVTRPTGDVLASAPDAILVTGWQHYGMLQCLRAAVRSGKPVLVRAESNGLAPVGLLRRLKARVGLAGVRQVLPIGSANRAFYVAAGLGQRLGPTVPYFVDNDFFAARAAALRHARPALRRSLGIPEPVVCFLFAGKLLEKKRPMDAVRALKSAIQTRGERPLHLLVTGSGELQRQIEQYARDHDLPVSFSGFLNQSEMPRAYAACDCLVLPSDYGETWGLVVNEAMACGLPAIVSDRVGCGPDLVEDGETGFRHAFGDTASLAAGMSRLAALTNEQRSEMGARARQRVMSGYSVERAAERTVEAVWAALSH